MRHDTDILEPMADLLTEEELAIPIHIIGLGGGGSFIAEVIARMGFSLIHLYDPDTVEPRNILVQNYVHADISAHKAEAMLSRLRTIRGDRASFTSSIRYVTEQTRTFEGIVISCVDHMDKKEKGRKAIWEAMSLENRRDNIDLYIDARMAVVPPIPSENSPAEIWYDIYALRPRDEDDRLFYEKWLFSDAEGTPQICTASNISFLGPYVAGVVGSVVYSFLAGNSFPLKQQKNLLDVGSEYVIISAGDY